MNGRPDLVRRAAAEAIGAFALVFAGCGAIVTEAEHPGSLGTVGIALVFGLVIMAMVYATGHLSGAHLNPAVTLAFALTRHFPRREALAYIAAQLAGALAAARPARGIWPSQPAAARRRRCPTVGAGSALVYEAVLTAFLMFVIMAVATDTRAVGAGAAIAIGGTVGLDALFGGPITGASMNPARSLGPALVSGELHDLWIYIAGPDRRRGDRRRSPTSWSAGGDGEPETPDGPRPLRLPPQCRPLADQRGAVRHGRRGAATRPAPPGPARRAGPPRGGRGHGRARHRPLGPRAAAASTEDAEWADVVVTMGCGDECPYIPGKRYVDWDLPDPKGQSLDVVRGIRDEIGRRVAGLLAELDSGPN